MIDSFVKVINGTGGITDYIMFAVDVFVIYLILKLIIFLVK